MDLVDFESGIFFQHQNLIVVMHGDIDQAVARSEPYRIGCLAEFLVCVSRLPGIDRRRKGPGLA